MSDTKQVVEVKNVQVVEVKNVPLYVVVCYDHVDCAKRSSTVVTVVGHFAREINAKRYCIEQLIRTLDFDSRDDLERYMKRFGELNLDDRTWPDTLLTLSLAECQERYHFLEQAMLDGEYTERKSGKSYEAFPSFPKDL